MVWELVVILSLAACHLVAAKLRFLHYVPRSSWLSVAGGLAIAYVFVHLLPELASRQGDIASAGWWGPLGLDEAIYLVALAGLIGFYGLAHLTQAAKHRDPAGNDAHHTSAGTFWVHIGSFGLYNLLVGYLVHHREDPTQRGLWLFGLAMLGHFIVTDFGLREQHRGRYSRYGRWLLATAVISGWVIGLLTTVSLATVGLLFAFLGGGVILNTIKEEVPREHQSRFLPFLAGAVAYTALLLAV